MQLALNNRDEGPALAPISPMREMGAYEALWLERSASFKTIAERFASDPDAMPSDLVTPARAEECARRVLSEFEKQLGVKKGGTTANKKFHLVEEECIAACANAPCAVVGTKYFLDIVPSDVAKILAELERDPSPEGEVV